MSIVWTKCQESVSFTGSVHIQSSFFADPKLPPEIFYLLFSSCFHSSFKRLHLFQLNVDGFCHEVHNPNNVNPPKTACGCPCSGVIEKGHTCNPLTSKNIFVNVQLQTPICAPTQPPPPGSAGERYKSNKYPHSVGHSLGNCTPNFHRSCVNGVNNRGCVTLMN